MVAKIPVEIDVDQAGFLAFYDAFQKFKGGLGEAGDEWGQLGDGIRKGADNALVLRDRIGGVEEAMQRITGFAGGLKTASDATSRAWGALSRHTRDVAGHIKEATTALLRWTALTSIVGGLAGFGGMVGMDAIGGHVAAGRTGAMQAGTTYGARESFAINFGRFGGAESILGRVASIMSSADKTALWNLGFSDEELRKGDPADIAAKAFEKLRERAKGMDKGFLGDWLRSNRIDEVFDLGQAMQARDTSDDEMREVQKNYARDKKRLEMTPESQLAWTKFIMQLELSAGVVKKAFTETLSRLTGGLGALSKAFTDLLDRLFKQGGPVEHMLEALDKRLNKLADDISSPEFEKRIKEFFEGVKSVARWTVKLLDGLLGVARWFGIAPAAAATPGGAAGGASSPQQGGIGMDGKVAPFSRADDEDPEVVEFIRKKAIELGIDPNVALGVARSEGLKGFSPSKGTWSAGYNDAKTSWGPFQAHFHSDIPGFRARGQADAFFEQTGKRADDMRNWKDLVEWQLRYAKEHGWREWHGWKGPPRAGLDVAPMRKTDAERAGERAVSAPPAPAFTQQVPKMWRTVVKITKAPGGDAALGANAAASP